MIYPPKSGGGHRSQTPDLTPIPHLHNTLVLAAWCSLFVLAGFFSWQFGPVSAGSERERARARGVNSFHIFFDTIVMNFYIFQITRVCLIKFFLA